MTPQLGVQSLCADFLGEFSGIVATKGTQEEGPSFAVVFFAKQCSTSNPKHTGPRSPRPRWCLIRVHLGFRV